MLSNIATAERVLGLTRALVAVAGGVNFVLQTNTTALRALACAAIQRAKERGEVVNVRQVDAAAAAAAAATTTTSFFTIVTLLAATPFIVATRFVVAARVRCSRVEEFVKSLGGLIVGGEHLETQREAHGVAQPCPARKSQTALSAESSGKRGKPLCQVLGKCTVHLWHQQSTAPRTSVLAVFISAEQSRIACMPGSPQERGWVRADLRRALLYALRLRGFLLFVGCATACLTPGRAASSTALLLAGKEVG